MKQWNNKYIHRAKTTQPTDRIVFFRGSTLASDSSYFPLPARMSTAVLMTVSSSNVLSMAVTRKRANSMVARGLAAKPTFTLFFFPMAMILRIESSRLVRFVVDLLTIELSRSTPSVSCVRLRADTESVEALRELLAEDDVRGFDHHVHAEVLLPAAGPAFAITSSTRSASFGVRQNGA